MAPRPVIEPFDSDKHNRAGFSCGVEGIDNYFRKTANAFAKADLVRFYVMADSGGAVIGFHTVNAHSVACEELPDGSVRRQPRHGNIPAAYISMMGRHVAHCKKGYGSALLVDALKRIARAADAIGVAVVMLDVFDCGDPEKIERRKALYGSFGFAPLPSNGLRMFLPMKTVRDLLAREAADGDTETPR